MQKTIVDGRLTMRRERRVHKQTHLRIKQIETHTRLCILFIIFIQSRRKTQPLPL